MSVRPLLGVLALLGVALGVTGILAPELLVYDIGTFLIAAAGVVAIIVGLHGAIRGWQAPRLEALPPVTDRVGGVPAPGDDIDRDVRLATPPAAYIREQRRLHQRTARLLQKALVLYRGHDQEKAERTVERGEWTEDPAAALFVTGRVFRGSFTHRLRRRLRSEYPLEEGFRRTVLELATLIPHDIAPEEVPTSRFSLGNLRSGVTSTDASPIETGHWRGISVVALVCLGAGVGVQDPGLVLAGAVGIGYIVYANSGEAPTGQLVAERTFSTDHPVPGDVFEVRLTVKNAGEQFLPDVRIIDELPEGLSVVEGMPSRSAALRPGSMVMITYQVEARAGTHRFERTRAILRSLNGSHECTQLLDVPAEITCKPRPEPIDADVPLRTSAARYVGQLRTDTAGEGIEFQAVREYRPGDRLSRIDWTRYARTKELTTIDFHEEKAATIVLMIDARADAYLAPDADSLNAVHRSVGMANRVLVSLVNAGHRVGLAAMSPREPCWLSPSASRNVEDEARALLTEHHSFDASPPTEEFRTFGWVEWFAARAPRDSQVLMFSPLCDPLIEEAIVRVEARGHPVTIISPDPTTGDSVGHQLAQLERRTTIDSLRRRGLRVIDWPDGEPIEMSLDRLSGRDAR